MRKIKLGYVSPDFRQHPVYSFFKPLLLSHNRDLFTIYCYSNVSTPDDITTYIKSLSDHWRHILGMDDNIVANLIKSDGIDILVDLSGHTANNRLKVFALKPAPVQITYLGYPNTTGLSTMDYRFTDNIADPPRPVFDITYGGTGPQRYTEKLIHLKDGFLCYSGDESIPPRSAPPCIKNGYITLGSFNNLPKLSPETIALWSSILQSLPDSRLILKARQFKDKTVRQRYRKLFKVAPKRIKLLPMTTDFKDHLELYNKIDIALDPFPYNGTTTTCEALWMGVPVVTLLGKHHAGRVGASILNHVAKGLITEDQDHYKGIVVALAERIMDGYTLDTRELMINSPLCDCMVFIKNIEDAYVDMMDGKL